MSSGDGGVKRCGFVALIGRPNVGKSTLVNHILGQKISATSSRPQTTRRRIWGVKTSDATQVIYVDTPGLHTGERRELNRVMNAEAKASIHDVDVVAWMVRACEWREEDATVLAALSRTSVPVLIVVNQIDRVSNRAALLPFMDKLNGLLPEATVMLLSAKTGDGLDVFQEAIAELMPEGPFCFPSDQVTNQSDLFIAAELIREKLMRALTKELPYALAVSVDSLEKVDDLQRVHAIIWVEKESQKPIVIGKKGALLKHVGQQAREELERYWGCQVYLNLWVKVKSDWQDQSQFIQKLHEI